MKLVSWKHLRDGFARKNVGVREFALAVCIRIVDFHGIFGLEWNLKDRALTWLWTVLTLEFFSRFYKVCEDLNDLSA